MWSSTRNSCSAVVPAQAGTQYRRGGCCEAEASVARPVFTGPRLRGDDRLQLPDASCPPQRRDRRSAHAAIADKGQPLEQRKAIYAPWSPDQMAQRRKEQGLIGPGTTQAGAAAGLSLLSEEARTRSSN